jgi:hypothetical protein
MYVKVDRMSARPEWRAGWSEEARPRPLAVLGPTDGSSETSSEEECLGVSSCPQPRTSEPLDRLPSDSAPIVSRGRLLYNASGTGALVVVIITKEGRGSLYRVFKTSHHSPERRGNVYHQNLRPGNRTEIEPETCLSLISAERLKDIIQYKMQENVAKLYPTPETSAKVLNCKWLA